MEAQVPPAPPGANPEQWNWSQTYRMMWQKEHPQEPAQQQQQNPNWKRVPADPKASPVANNQSYQDLQSIQTAVKTYMGRLPGMPRLGTLRNLPDVSLQTTIFNKIKSHEISLQPSEVKAMESGRGVHFYQRKDGSVGFVINN